MTIMGHSILDMAAAQGYCNAVRAVLARGADVNASTPSGRTALHCAAFGDQAAAVDTLVANGAHIEAADNQGSTALHVASVNGSYEAIVSLLHHGAVKNKLNNDGRSPLLLAVENGHRAAAMLLLHVLEEEDEGTVNHRHGSDEYSALDLAVQRGQLEISRMIVRHGAHVNAQDSEGVSALYLAALNDQTAMIDLLVTAGANVEAQAHGRHNRTALHIACAEGSNEALKSLLKHGASSSKCDSGHLTSLHLAARNGDATTVKILLAWGSDPTFRSPGMPLYRLSALDEASYWGNVRALRVMCNFLTPKKIVASGVTREILYRIWRRDMMRSIGSAVSVAAARNHAGAIDVLVEAGGADVEEERGLEGTPIHYAADTGAAAAIATLALHGADLNSLGGLRNKAGLNKFVSKGRTALHTVAFFGWTKAAEALLVAGANPTCRCQYGDNRYRPLDIASEKGHVGVMREIIKHGVCVDAADPCKGTTALHIAAAFNKICAIGVLAEAGCNVDAPDDSGSTPFHACATNHSCAAVAALAAIGADVNKVNLERKSPLHLALTAPHGIDTIKALLAVGADTNTRNNENASALDLAAKAGDVAVIRALIGAGAPVDAENADGRTALMHAVKENNASAVDELLSAGARVEAHLDGESWTSLHSAVEDTNVEVVRVLLKHGANVHAKDADNDNDTPLHVAVRQAGVDGAAEIVKALLRHGADEEARNDNGLTPLSVVGSMGGPGAALPVMTLLLCAPGDRAWRRRGLLILSCARAKRTSPATATDVSPRGKQGQQQRRKCTRREEGRGRETRDLAATSVTNDNFDQVAAWLLELQEEGLFRIVVGFL